MKDFFKFLSIIAWLAALIFASGITTAHPVFAHGTHLVGSSGQIIGAKYEGLAAWWMITTGETDEAGNLVCDHIKKILFTKEIIGHPTVPDHINAIHILDIRECEDWDNI